MTKKKAPEGPELCSHVEPELRLRRELFEQELEDWALVPLVPGVPDMPGYCPVISRDLGLGEGPPNRAVAPVICKDGGFGHGSGFRCGSDLSA